MKWANDDDDNVLPPPPPPPPQANDRLSQMLAHIRSAPQHRTHNNNNNHSMMTPQYNTPAFATTNYTGNSAPGRIQDMRRSRNSLSTVSEIHPYHQATATHYRRRQQQQQSQHEQQVVGDRQSNMGTTNYNNHRNQTFDLGYQNQQQQWPPSCNGIGDGNNNQQQQQQQQPTMNPLLRMMEERMAAQDQQQRQQATNNDIGGSNHSQQPAQVGGNTTTTTAIPQHNQHQPPPPPMTNQEKVRQISNWNSINHPQQITRFNGLGDKSSTGSFSSGGSGSTGRGSSSSSRGKKRSSTATYYDQHQLQRRRQTNSMRTVGESAMLRHSFNSSSPRGLDRTSVSLSEVDRLRIANHSNHVVQHHQQQYNFTTAAAATAASALGSVSNPHQSTSQEDMNKLQAETLAKLKKRNVNLQSQDSLQSLGSRTLSMASSNSSTNKMASRTSDVSM